MYHIHNVCIHKWVDSTVFDTNNYNQFKVSMSRVEAKQQQHNEMN